MERDFSQECVICEKALTGISAYSTIYHEADAYKLCCPLCTDVFMEKKSFYILKRKALEAGQRLKYK